MKHNVAAKALASPQFRQQIVKPKKGKGSFKRTAAEKDPS